MDKTPNQLFHQVAFDTKQQTCLQTNWSKSSIRYLLFQKYCNCALAPDLPHLHKAGTRQLKKKDLLSHSPQKMPECLS